MSIHNKSIIALGVALSSIAGCSTPSNYTRLPDPLPKATYEVPVMREVPIVSYEPDYPSGVDGSMYDVPIVEAQPEIEPVVPSSADDLYDQAKDIMQATSDPAAQAAAVELLTQAASMGHAESMRVLGLLALKQGPDRQAEAIELLERSAKTSVKAMRQLGILYGNLGSTHLDNTDKAIEYFQRASALGDGESSLYLSKVMARLGLQDDAKRWKEVAAEQGAVAAGAVTSTNPLPDRDDSMMRSYTLQRAAMAGDPASMYDYSLMLLNKQAQGALIGYEHAAEFEAYYWLRRSSQLGYTKATMKLDEVGYIESLMNASKLTFDKLNRAMSGART